MAGNRYFAGNSLAAFFRTSTAIAEITTAGYFDSAYVASAISLPDNSNPAQTTTFSATGTLYARFTYRFPNTSTSASSICILRNGTTQAYRLIHIAGTGLILQHWNGSAWVSTGTGWNGWSTSTRYVFMLKLALNNSWELFANGTSVCSGSGITGAQTTVTDGQFYSVASGTAAGLSEVMFADYDIRDSHYSTVTLNGNSATNTGQASGAYPDVNETVLDESTNVAITASGNKAGMTHAALTVPAGYVIAAAVINARGRATGTIADGKLGVRSGGANYSSSGRGYNGGYEPRSYIVDNDPATATRFTQAGFNAAEPYLEAA